MSYATLDQFHQWAAIESEDEGRDADITRILAAATEMIDGHCGRSFGLSASDARVFQSGNDSRYVDVDEFVGAVTATINGNAVAVTAVPVVGRPSSQLKGSFGYGTDVVVTATWGWSAPPAAVTQATLMLALKLYERRQSPYGVQGQADIGFIRVTGVDRDVEQLLAPYVRLSAFLA